VLGPRRPDLLEPLRAARIAKASGEPTYVRTAHITHRRPAHLFRTARTAHTDDQPTSVRRACATARTWSGSSSRRASGTAGSTS
jgi:hypothetical protein